MPLPVTTPHILCNVKPILAGPGPIREVVTHDRSL